MRKNVSSRIKNIKLLLSSLAAFAVLAVPFAVPKVFAATRTVCDSGCDFTTIQEAIDAADPGDIVSISGSYTVTSPVFVNKDITLAGQSGAAINTSGNNQVFTITANGATISNLAFTRTESDVPGSVSQNMVGIQANNVTIKDSTFTGQYFFGNDGVSRAIVVSPGVTGFDIKNNQFTKLRQPMYSDGSGAFTNNYTAGTRGAVISSNTNIVFSGNTWGTGADRNILDVAIIAAGSNNYTDANIVQMSDNNNDAVVENQFPTPRVLSDVFVDAAAAAGGNGLPGSPYNTIDASSARVADGGTVNIASGTYPVTSQTTFDKSVNVRGVGTKPQLNVSGGAYYVFLMRGANSTLTNLALNKTDSVNQNMVGIQANNVTISNNTFSGQYVLGGGETTRAMEVSGYTGTTITGNTISNLRQPAYINGGSTGSLLNNSVNVTRGWVIEANTDYTITGNTFSGNATDVAIIPGSPNNYDCPRTNVIRSTNNNANVDNQVLGSSCPENVPPSVPTNGLPNNSFKNTNDFYFTWDASTDNAPGVIKYEFQSAGSNNVDGNGSLIGAWNSIANGNSEQNNLTSPTIHSTGAPDGTYYWQVRAIDAVGNKSAWSETWKMTIDTVPPTKPTSLSFVNPTLACGAFTNSYNVTATWGAVADAVQYEYWVTTPMRNDANAWVTTVGTNSYAGAFNEGQGAYTFKVRSIDASGLKSDWSNTCVVNYDATAPDAYLVSPSDNAVVTGASVTQTWGSGATDIDHYVYESYNDAAGTSLRWRENFTGTSKTATNVANATYWWRVKAIDKTGNESAWTPLWKLTVDSTAPGAVTLVSPANNALINTSNFDFSWNAASDASAVTYEWQSSYSTAVNGSGAFVSPIVTHTGLNGTTISSPGTPDNTYYWHVRAKDAAGNYSAWSATWKVTVDTTPPVITGDSIADGGSTVTPSLVATDNNPGVMTYQWTADDPSYAGIISDDTILNPTFTPTTSGNYSFTLRATDLANNTSSAFAFSFTYTAPVIEDVVTTPGNTETPNNNGGTPFTAFTVTNPIAAVVVPAAPAGAQAGGAAGAADGGQAAQQDGQVLGANTDNEQNNNRNGQTLGSNVASTTDEAGAAKKSLNWLWILLGVLAVGVLLWLIFGRRKHQEG